MNRKTFLRLLVLGVSAVSLIGLAVLYFVFDKNVLFSFIISVLFIGTLLFTLFSIETMQNEANRQIENSIGLSTKQALNLGNIGILVYSDDYQITWMSDFFSNRDLSHIGEKILNWIPELQELLQGDSERTNVVINDEKYEINKISNASVLIFKDITNEYELKSKIEDDAYVIGLLSYDNYDEAQDSEDDLTFINNNIKKPVTEYFKKFNCVYKTLKNNRMLLILNEKIFSNILDDRFSILKQIRKVSQDASIDVTLSIAFSRGSDNLEELDNVATELLELAQTRGGDQVVVRKIGEDVSFFGGTSEAREKLNKTKVRVNLNSIKDLISKSSNVIIVGHRDADADCIGAALCMSSIALALNCEPYIVCKTGGVEPMIADVMKKYEDVLKEKHKLVSEEEALAHLNENSLVIMVDHHSIEQSNAAQVVEKANQIVVIDHHRRKADLDISPIMVYVEASASSTCELICEFLPYLSRNIDISEEEANIMYLGILIDTDRFRVRTGTRTFDVAKQLKQYGANPSECDKLAEEPYDMIISRSSIISAGKSYRNDVVISALEEGIYNRSIASQACDMMVKAKEIEAAFVICNSDKDETIISARSNGKINVQVILEKLNGGGHMTAAGLQRKDESVAKLENELLQALDEYFKGDDNDESNTIE